MVSPFKQRAGRLTDIKDWGSLNSGFLFCFVIHYMYRYHLTLCSFYLPVLRELAQENADILATANAVNNTVLWDPGILCLLSAFMEWCRLTC